MFAKQLLWKLRFVWNDWNLKLDLELISSDFYNKLIQLIVT